MPGVDQIPLEVLTFIDRHMTSVDQLETLLLLSERRDRSWTAHQISAELRTNETVAEQRLRSIHEMGVLEVDDRGYRYVVKNTDLDRVVRLLADVYRDYRLRIVERIYKKPDSLAAFADAFRIRDRKP